MKNEAGKGDEMQARDRGGKAFVILGQPPETRRPREGPLHHPPPRQQHEALPRSEQSDDDQLDPPLRRRLGRLLPGVPLIGPAQPHGDARRFLHRVGQRTDLRALLLVRRRHPQRQQLPHRIDRRVELAAPDLLVPIVPGPMPALRGAGQRPRVQHDRRRVGLAARCLAQQCAQVVNHVREAAGGGPSLRLLVDRRPGRKVTRQVAPRRAGSDDPAQGVVDLTHVMPALRGVRRNQRQLGGDERPRVVSHITGIGLAGHRAHLLSLRPHQSP